MENKIQFLEKAQSILPLINGSSYLTSNDLKLLEFIESADNIIAICPRLFGKTSNLILYIICKLLLVSDSNILMLSCNDLSTKYLFNKIRYILFNCPDNVSTKIIEKDGDNEIILTNGSKICALKELNLNDRYTEIFYDEAFFDKDEKRINNIITTSKFINSKLKIISSYNDKNTQLVNLLWKFPNYVTQVFA